MGRKGTAVVCVMCENTDWLTKWTICRSCMGRAAIRWRSYSTRIRNCVNGLQPPNCRTSNSSRKLPTWKARLHNWLKSTKTFRHGGIVWSNSKIQLNHKQVGKLRTLATQAILQARTLTIATKPKMLLLHRSSKNLTLCKVQMFQYHRRSVASMCRCAAMQGESPAAKSCLVGFADRPWTARAMPSAMQHRAERDKGALGCH